MIAVAAIAGMDACQFFNGGVKQIIGKTSKRASNLAEGERVRQGKTRLCNEVTIVVGNHKR
jgi:hypothetical protein